MLNKIKEIVNRLDGYSDTELSFAVLDISRVSVEIKELYTLNVAPYYKNGDEVSEEECAECLSEMAHRLAGYKDDKFVITKALCLDKTWELKVEYYERKNNPEE